MQFAARLLLLCTIGFLTYGAMPEAQPVPLSQLLAKMRTVNGGLYNMHLVSTSEHKVDGVPAQATTESMGLAFVVRDCTGPLCVGSYFDGERLYQFNVNGTMLPGEQQYTPYLRAMRTLGMLAFLDPHFEQQGGRIDDAGSAQFGDCTCRALVVQAPDAVPVSIYVDPRTGLVAGARDQHDDMVVKLANYHHVAAFQLPFDVDVNGEAVERYTSRTIEWGRVEPPKGVDTTITAGEPGLTLDSAAVSPIGTCKIAGIEARCLIDTGNSTLSMSEQLAQRLNLKPIWDLPIAGLGTYSAPVVRAGPLQVGNATFGQADYLVLTDAERYGYDLVLGADVLANAPVSIDYEHHVLTFGNADPPGQSNTLPIEFDKLIPVVNASLGSTRARLAIDTGDESSINLAYDFYQKHPDLFTVTSTAQVGGVGGISVEDMGELPEIRLGGIAAQDQPIGATRTLHGTADGHLGAAFLSKFRIVLDYPHQRMYLTPL